MSVRVRLTLSYVGFLIVAGLVLLAMLYWLLHFIPNARITNDGPYVPNRGDLLRVFWPRALEALGGLTAVGVVGGWFVAGRMLRPLERIADVAREVTGGSFDRRVRLRGREDEYGLLAATFDAMLDRVEATLAEQRRFAANASHELRTPLAVSQTMIDVALADPQGRDVDELLGRLQETTRRGTQIIESLLSLTAIDQRDPAIRPVDLGEMTLQVVDELRSTSEDAGLAISVALDAGRVDGEPTLLHQLVFNLVLNAIRHNIGSGGQVRVATTTDRDAVELGVANTGPVVTPKVLATLTEPFVRGGGRVVTEHRGSGLGLAIVARIAETHGALLQLAARPEGGLDVRVRFRASPLCQCPARRSPSRNQ